MNLSDMIPLDVVRDQFRRQLWIETTADALDLLTELWPQTRDGGGVYFTADQWKRLRQVLLRLPDLGD